MAALNFDTLEYVKQLTDAGVERQVAEIHAITVGRAMGMYVNNLVTQEYLDATLDARFAQQSVMIEKRFAEQDAKFDKRFAEQDVKFDKRFTEQDVKFDKRFAEQDVKFDKRFAEQDAKFDKRFNALEDRIAPMELAVQSIQVTQRFQSGLLLILVAGLLVPPVLSLISSFS
ncbi:MAG: hypothetical protein ACPG6R_05085 [Aequoribacter sp.]|uniref:hypothetical protein n=1 Tax=Aequoribacter sp. TaxID=2847771 RepID=UPI003C46D0F3